MSTLIKKFFKKIEKHLKSFQEALIKANFFTVLPSFFLLPLIFVLLAFFNFASWGNEASKISPKKGLLSQ